MKRIAIYIVMSLLIYPLLSPITLFAGEVKLTDARLTNHEGKLLLSLKAQGCFTKEMEDVIVSGIPTTFTFKIKLDRARRFRRDEKIARLKIDHTIKFDNLKCNFRISLSERSKDIIVNEFSEAKEIMRSLTNVVVISTKELQKDVRYRLKAKAELNKVELPFYLHYVFFFVRLWNFETDWITINFTPSELLS
ncbi:MAG TPA: DUF4390 domain-containing protein [Syntrophaceae bacterium]|nr:DUF4390 domain-containing protein [Syntrophaceae bacterium]